MTLANVLAALSFDGDLLDVLDARAVRGLIARDREEHQEWRDEERRVAERIAEWRKRVEARRARWRARRAT